MREGYKTILEFLENDIKLEREQEAFFKKLADVSVEADVKAGFEKLMRVARGHAEGLEAVIRQIECDEHRVTFYCPVCGWVVDFGVNPYVGNEARCTRCCQRFALVEKGGDFGLAAVAV